MRPTYVSIYNEIGAGKRSALAKLVVEHFENTGRAFRIAVDISIWQFQIQAAQGGTNPALRTLYYRLLRLHTLGIEALFVFDGPNKPPVKRGKKTAGQHAASLPNFLAKKLIQALGFPYHSAPGEAEAECAALQKSGVVDAVLSEDVDTLMFGATCTMKNWSSAGTRGNKQPTHVDFYDAGVISESGLDRPGMILVALMSGGDYTPDGIEGCGTKVACQAARAGFGRDLLDIGKSDDEELCRWRERLQHELITNESKFFGRKNRNLKIPADFPDQKCLSYYAFPVISSSDAIERLRAATEWNPTIDVPALRTFVAEAFEWEYIMGARKLIRGLAPAILTKRLLHRQVGSNRGESSDDEFHDKLSLQEWRERKLVKAFHSRRTHFMTDGQKEVSISYIPSDVVEFDLSKETLPDIQGYDNGTSDTDDSAARSEPEVPVMQSPQKPRARKPFDPSSPQKLWILETLLKVGVPLSIEMWEEEMQDPKKFASRKARVRKQLKGMEPGAMDKYVKVTKPGMSRNRTTSPQPDNDGFKIDSATLKEKSGAKQRRTPECEGKSVQIVQGIPVKEKNKKTSKDPPPPTDPKTNPWILARTRQGALNSKLTTSTLAALSSGKLRKRSPIKDPVEQKDRQTRKTASNTVLISSSPPPVEPTRSVITGDAIPHGSEPVEEQNPQHNTPTPPPIVRTNEHLQALPSSSPASSLPSPSILFSRPKPHPPDPETAITSSPIRNAPAPITMSTKHKRGVTLRESLEGAWTIKEDEEEGITDGKTKRRYFSRVSMVDLTDD